MALDLRSALAAVSIRGRFAFALVCIERAARLLDVHDEAFDRLLESLWTFTTASNLADWETEVLGQTTGLLATIDGGPFDGEDPLVALPDPLRRLLYDAIEEVGRGNLYGAVVGDSTATLKGVLTVVDGARRLGVEIPALDRFGLSNFQEFHGWGDPRPRSFFVDG